LLFVPAYCILCGAMDDFRADFPNEAVSINDSYRFAYSQILFERGGKDGFCFLPPLAWLLYRMNSPSVPMPERDAAARAALPYCMRRCPRRSRRQCHSTSAVSPASMTSLKPSEGHSIEVGQYSCRAESGPQAGSVGSGTDMWEWNGPKAILISSSGVARKPGATSAWKFTEGEQTLTITDGKVTGCTGSGRGKNLVATGGWASMAGTSFTCTWKCVGPASQFSSECTNE
jgi:hypothetical protein